MDVKERIQQYIDFKKINVNKLEVSIGVSKSYWRKTNSISANVVSVICSIYSDLSPEWVMTGNGTMIKSTSEIISEDNQNNNTDMELKTLLDVIKRQNAIIDNLENEVIRLNEELGIKNERSIV